MTFEERRELRSLQRRIRELEAQVEQDPLTGLLNRRGAERRLSEATSYAARAKTTLAVALLDVDHFKQVNDTCGHDVGDDTLRQVGQTIRHIIRQHDAAARWGGEEFLLILPNLSKGAAVALAERLRSFIERHLNVTVSIGVSMVLYDDWKLAVCRADAALYAAKDNGRNCVSHG
jgi:diguanylate cyclase (GGDEF)-like protein